MSRISKLALVGAAMMTVAPNGAFAQGRPAQATNAQKMQANAMADVPRCTRKLGTLSITNGDDPRGWNQYNLAPPAKLLRSIVQKSGCFNLVDRGAGLNAAVTERDIGAGLGMQRGSNVGQGQVKAADYVLVAEVQAANGNAGGSALAGIAGGLIGGTAGGLIGGIKTRKLEANTVLSLTNVRTTETIAVTDGYAVKNDIGWGAGGGAGGFGGFGGAVGGGYEDTDTGRIVTLAFVQAYSKMVNELGLVSNQGPAAQAAPSKTFTATAPVNMRRTADAKGALVRTLQPGSIVYPTGQKNGLWWEVSDENDNVGWVLNTKLEPSR
ncbi:SH3 domain-containing protein [Phenylobacterium sp. Root700]|uniref:SH3 domain-containing protein n=1 Tax=Phenylobacterium sp. Root700 TaxID=1736591 RepID=UPI0006FF3BA1|nr:SH3 domain-containing protein [Phenylobacterium sp. Root700]KRB40109.1 curli production assembly/transport component csgg [Phenylobacterium sp. Root700]